MVHITKRLTLNEPENEVVLEFGNVIEGSEDVLRVRKSLNPRFIDWFVDLSQYAVAEGNRLSVVVEDEDGEELETHDCTIIYMVSSQNNMVKVNLSGAGDDQEEYGGEDEEYFIINTPFEVFANELKDYRHKQALGFLSRTN